MSHLCRGRLVYSNRMDADSKKTNPLAVDLDGTLIRSDLFVESLLALLRRNPLYLLLLPLWWFSGRASLKRRIAQRVQIDPSSLPYRDSVLGYVREQAAAGRPVILATGSDQSLAQAVAGCELNFFIAKTDWFFQVINDMGMTCYCPATNSLAILAVTDTD